VETIFIVVALIDYSPSRPVKAFKDAAQAEKFRRCCTEHLVSTPISPSISASDIEWDVYDESLKKWLDESPDPERCADKYSVAEVPFE